MGKKLIITEKPSVAQEFARVLHVSGRKNGYLENDQYVITWCVGHLVEMVYPEDYDEKYRKWKLEDLPFLPKTYKYNVIENVRGQYDIVENMLHREDIDTVYWAGDSGKEGQTIEENIRNFGGVREGMEERRVWIDSQTEEEILRGIREARPMSDYANLGKSGIMRTIEDYAMGINFSRVMSVKYGRLLNDAAGTQSYTAIAVGRVMTCVLGMVVIREREIRNFAETPFYRVAGNFLPMQTEHSGHEKTDMPPLQAQWKAVEGSKYFQSPLLYKENGFKRQEDARAMIQELEQKPATVKELELGTSKKRAPLLFNLAELQAECSKRFKISPDQTLQVAQDLYEKKLTTYPRTDARVLSTAVAKEIHKNLNKLTGYQPTAKFAETILKNRLYTNIARAAYTDDSKVTDHYAIIPTGQLTEYGSLNDLQRKVYDLIVRRFLSIFYPPAEYDTAKLTVQVNNEKFFASARALRKEGYLEIAGVPKPNNKDGAKEGDESNESSDSDEVADSAAFLACVRRLKVNDALTATGYELKEGKTSPPKRYTSGSMVLAMENAGQLIEDEELREQIKGSGIGTSATRAEIIRKLVRIGYLNLNQKTQILSPERMGEMVYEVVAMTVPALLNPKMSASWEKGLDGITNGTVIMEDYREKLEHFIRTETISMKDQDLRVPLAEKISPFAGKNGKGMGARRKIGAKCPLCGGEIGTTPFGFGCSNYKKDDLESCKFSIGKIAEKELTEEQVLELLHNGKTGTIRGFKSKTGKKFDACLALDKDEQGKVTGIKFDFENVEPAKVKDVVCPLCGGDIVKTPFGYGCAKYDKNVEGSCKFSIGKIAGKDLSESAVRELINTGKTSTIRGFKSKTGKKFDACLRLDKDENGTVKGIAFDFENVEPVKIKGVVCPLCGGEITKTPFGYGCANYDRNDENSCKFSIGKIAGVSLKEAQVKQLLTEKHTTPIEGFVAKTGMMFTAPLKLTEEGQITFDFPEKPAPVPSHLVCPKCGKTMMKEQWAYTCECGFKLRHTVAQVELPEAVLQELLETGKTGTKIAGFVSRSGSTFETCLKYENDKIEFDFENPGMTPEKKEGKENGSNENQEPV